MKLTKKIDRFIDKLQTCPDCKHKSAVGIEGCYCERKDCTCNDENWS